MVSSLEILEHTDLALMKSLSGKSKRKKGSAAFAFTLAAWTGSHKSIETTAKRAILVEDLKSPGFRAPQEWMEKLVRDLVTFFFLCAS